MTDKLVIIFPNADSFEVDAKFIAENRAAYYAKLDVERGDSDNYESTFKLEVEAAIRDDYELSDWMFNNMNWSDVEPHAKRIDKAEKYDYAKAWGSAEVRRRKG